MRLRGLRPSPAIVIAVLALVAAVAGTAVAGGPGATTSVSKKKAKQIAKKQVNKLAPGIANQEITERAPGLNVDKVDGFDAAQISPASSTDVQSANQDLISTDQVVLSTTITTSGSRLLADAAIRLDSLNGGNDDEVVCFLRIDGTDGPPYRTGIPDVGADQTTIPLVYGQVVGAGTHTVEALCREAAGDSEVEDAGLNVSAHI
jgi:hypothetical protein